MSTPPEDVPPAVEPLDPARFEEHFDKAKRRIAEVKALLYAHASKADQPVAYTQRRHTEIDRLLQVILAEATLLSRIGGDRRRALEDRVRVLESRLAVLEDQTRQADAEREDEPRRTSPPKLSAVS